MKKLKKKTKLKKTKVQSLIIIIDNIIENRLFKPIAIAIITSFILFQAFAVISSLIFDYKYSNIQESQNSVVKINISDKFFEIAQEQQVDHIVKSGDTFLKFLIDTDTKEEDIFSIIASLKKIFSPRSIVIGDNITIKYNVKIAYDDSKDSDLKNIIRKVTINKVEISHLLEEKIVISRQKDGQYKAKKVKIELETKLSRYKGVIKNGLFVDAVAAGVSPTSVMNMINLYSYDVDFQRDIRSKDEFEILVEGLYLENGKKVKDGNILYASLTLRDRPFNIYMHKVKDSIAYFDEKGNSVKKSLLKTPINGARVSSGFGMRRHPVLGYSRMHKGVDFAAARGTPILAAGSGRITHFGRRGSYGNYVRIKHSNGFSTAYAHASRFNRRFRRGSKVKQGDVIAYVGTTGRSTGPHLHFEVLRNGRQINPAKVKATSGTRLRGKKLKAFKKTKEQTDKYRKTIAIYQKL